jgi:DNA-binding Lrp family transcriptional regulator
MNEKIVGEILDILQNDAMCAVEDIAKMVGAPADEVRAAIQELEADKIIVKYAAVVNREKFNSDYTEAFIEVKVDPQRELGYDDIAKRIYRFPEVKSVYLMSGAYDLAVLLEAKSLKQISKFVFEKLAVLEGVRSTATHFVMRKYKDQGVIFAEEEHDDRLVVSP